MANRSTNLRFYTNVWQTSYAGVLHECGIHAFILAAYEDPYDLVSLMSRECEAGDVVMIATGNGAQLPPRVVRGLCVASFDLQIPVYVYLSDIH